MVKETWTNLCGSLFLAPTRAHDECGWIPNLATSTFLRRIRFFDRRERVRERGGVDARLAAGVYSDRVQSGSRHCRRGYYGTISQDPSHPQLVAAVCQPNILLLLSFLSYNRQEQSANGSMAGFWVGMVIRPLRE